MGNVPVCPPRKKAGEAVIEDQRKYLIVERSRLVGQDLADIVREFHPNALVELVSDLAEAETYAAGMKGLSLAFVGGAHSADMIDPLAATVATTGGRIVLMRRTSPGQQPRGPGPRYKASRS